VLDSGWASPTDSQIEAFADYVAGARSWYKHLPLNPPGALFQLYIDPHAGMDRVVLASGEISMLERTDETEAFHYSWLTTADYRARFGCLAFACGRGSALFQDAMLGDEPVLVDGNCLYPELRISKAVAERPPEEILETGFCWLTALVHPHATADFLAGQLASRKRSVPEKAELESGTWAAILEWWRKGQEVRNAKGEPAYQAGDDPVLAALVEQEKRAASRHGRPLTHVQRGLPARESVVTRTKETEMKNDDATDFVQALIDCIFQSQATYETKMGMLEAMEPSVEAAYRRGQTRVKPVRLMTADDLVS
jgi:hypothetical protein